MREAAKKMGLKNHVTGRAQKRLPFPGDVEGHHGLDGRFYVVGNVTFNYFIILFLFYFYLFIYF